MECYLATTSPGTITTVQCCTEREWGLFEGWRADMPGSSGWHAFGVDWKPCRLVLYYDGIEVGIQESGVTSKPHYTVVALAISGSTAATPQTMKVDYMRVWKRERKSGV